MKRLASILPWVTGVSLSSCFNPTPPVIGTGTETGTSSGSSGENSESSTTDPSATSTESGSTTETETTGTSEESSSTGPLTTCGNGVVEGEEQCDDEGESKTCNLDCTLAACGDAVLNAAAGEECDDGPESDGCDADCTTARCGDAYANLRAGEECDDGAETATCDLDCTSALCSDGTLNVTAGEECDEGGDTVACDVDCTSVACGDAHTNAVAGEGCDNGAPVAGCNAFCQVDPDFPPLACLPGADPLTNSGWVVCAGATPSVAWVANASASGGNYHPQLICESLGYSTFGSYGGTCGNVCGYCQAGSSCQVPGPQTFDGGGDCGSDDGGPILCVTVHWLCVN